MDRPQVDAITGIPPAIAIDQTNPVRTSRSTVGTMTEINDHLKLLYARAAVLHCRGCGEPVRRDTPDAIAASLQERSRALGDSRVIVTFDVALPESGDVAGLKALLATQGYARFLDDAPAGRLVVVQDRFRVGTADPARVTEAIEAALRAGGGRVAVLALGDDDTPVATWRWSSDLHCPTCDIAYADASPSSFSFNSPIGACDTCKGFGRVIGIDYDLVVPDGNRTLAGGAVKPWQTPSGQECQDDLVRHAKTAGIPLDRPWNQLAPAQRQWVIDGEPGKARKRWYGIKGYFEYLERKAYKMHVRVMLSKYRSYTHCPACDGARLKPGSLLWRLGPFSIHELMLLPVSRCAEFFASFELPKPLDEASDLVLGEIRSRLAYLCDVGLSYLTLDRQSRTLSGGEVQRINLTTALGTSLVNTLFVLDEPSIGLHPRDMERVIRVMKRLRDSGNSLVVVEHDPQIMLEADRVLDMGPGAGENGGAIVFQGTPAALCVDATSVTGAYLSGRRRIDVQRSAAREATPDRWLTLSGAAEHNLKDVDLRVPLGRLVAVTGVSGSGKSTLVEDVLYPALQRAMGRPAEAPGRFRALAGHEGITDVVMIDQTPVGRTTRSNPASYVGAFDAIRAQFAKLPDAVERKYTAGTFSFNSGNGRCPTCGGNGFEHIEMQLLSDVYLRCPDCSGRRFRDEVLEIRVEGAGGRLAHIADVLEMTVTEALAFFAGQKEIAARLQPLGDVGLDYLKLGQPVPTLSGGEAQRLKLAGHLADAGSGGAKLLLFDEPTTGLHFEDIARLMGAFDKLLAQGHSLLVIEHNLDVIRAADWVIDLGPGGGDAGGRIVAEGPPSALRANAASFTGRALADYERDLAGGGVREAAATAVEISAPPPDAIVVHHAREHNLKNIDVRIPHGGFTVITGVSGSGKSTLAFDIIFNEGQRRYLESLNAYARQFVQPASRPDVDAIHGIPPSVAIEQRTSRGGRKSTVATLTEIQHFLRLLYVKLGTQHCPDCDVAIEPQSAESIAARILRDHRGKSVTLLAPLVVARKGYYTDLATWAAAKGYAELRVDGVMTPTAKWPRLARYKEHDIELPVGTIDVSAKAEGALRELIDRALGFGKGQLALLPAGGKALQSFSAKRACPSCGRSFPELDPRLFSHNSPQGWCTTCFGTGQQLPGFEAEHSGEESGWDEGDGEAQTCESCDGARLNPTALAVRYRDHSIADLTALSVDDCRRFAEGLALKGREQAIARDVITEITSRLAFLGRVGLGYLTLDRAAPTLSGGETQRIRLAAQLGTNLRGVCYVLDEPTIGLHPRDNRILLDALSELASERNTLIVVEHDEDTIRRADHVIDLGPGAGVRGGEIVGSGTIDDLIANPRSTTGRYLKDPLRHPATPRRPVTLRGAKPTPQLVLEGVQLHNVDGIDVSIPLGRLVVVTGVSGSGKSTLARDVLFANLKQVAGQRPGAKPKLRGLKALRGAEGIERVLEVDQTPIGKTPRSCPATYVGFWDAIRRIYAGTTEAGIRGYGPGRFSFNTAGGRCAACEGQGLRTIEMSFLPDVKVLCDVCGGRRFDTQTQSIRWRDRSIGDVLAMNVEEAAEFFRSHPSVHHPLTLLNDVGLGYLTLGQQSPTLSGGEAQRIKLVTELARIRGDSGPLPGAPRRGGSTFYVLDEPTVGLHMADVQKLIGVFHRLVDAGNTVVIVEHNLDVMAQADWIIDMGPEAGAAGGKVVVCGTPSQVAARKGSRTGAVLAGFLEERREP
jgi:excinuclease ABC subunit A